MITFMVIVLILSIVMHEVAHGYAANALGDPTAKMAGRLTLNPIPHVDPIGSILLPGIMVLTQSPFLFGWAKPVPYNPYNLRNQRWGEAIVAIAGVATNFLLALIFSVVARIALAEGATTFYQLASSIVLVNLFLALFNLLPIPPLDGFTFLRGILPPKYTIAFREVEEKMQRGGIVTLMLVLFAFIYFFSAPFSKLVLKIFGVLIGS